MNPFKKEAFSKYWSTESKEVREEQEAIVKENPPTLEQVTSFVADAGSPRQLLDKLQFVYQSPYLADPIGWSKKPVLDGIGGYLSLEFYDQLLSKLDDDYQVILYPRLPGKIQENNEDLFLAYLKDPGIGNGRMSNYKGDKIPSDKILNWVLENKLWLVQDWKPEWWTPKLKTKAIKKSPTALAYIPESLLLKTEVRNFLKDKGESIKKNLYGFFGLLPESFQLDPDILGLTLNILNDGLSPIYKLRIDGGEIEKKMELEHYKAYFKHSSTDDKPIRKKSRNWSLVPDEFKDDLLDTALAQPRIATEVFLDDETELSNSQIDKFLDTFLASPADIARIALKLKKMDKLNLETMDKINIGFEGIEYLSKKEQNQLLDEEMVDYLLDVSDEDFIKRKTNWPKNVKMTRERFFNVMKKLDFRYSKVKSRVAEDFTEDDVVWLWLKAGELRPIDKNAMRNTLNALMASGHIEEMSKETADLLKELSDDADYDSYIDMKNIFLF